MRTSSFSYVYDFEHFTLFVRSVESFLCTSIVDLRAVYTPLLYLTTPTPVCRERVQATGHSLELNVLTDATLFIGYDQVGFNFNMMRNQSSHFALGEKCYRCFQV